MIEVKYLFTSISINLCYRCIAWEGMWEIRVVGQGDGVAVEVTPLDLHRVDVVWRFGVLVPVVIEIFYNKVIKAGYRICCVRINDT